MSDTTINGHQIHPINGHEIHPNARLTRALLAGADLTKVS